MSENKIPGPFGLSMGMSLDELDAQPLEGSEGKYLLTSVPKQHPAFDTYAVQVGINSGLSWIKAIGKDLETSVYGIELQTAFEDMKKKLDKAYGKSKLTDIILHESIWDEPRDWMNALLNKERVLMATWEGSVESTIKGDLISVGLIATASDVNTGYIAIEYQFKNEEECNAEIAALEDDAL